MTGLTWRELLTYIKNDMPERFLDTPIQVFDCLTGQTHCDITIYHDCTEDDFLVDIDQPQLFINYEEDLDE